MSQKRKHDQAFAIPTLFPAYCRPYYPYYCPYAYRIVRPFKQPIVDLTVLDKKPQGLIVKNTQQAHIVIQQTSENVSSFMKDLLACNENLRPVDSKSFVFNDIVTVTLFQFAQGNKKLWMANNTYLSQYLCSMNRGNTWRIISHLNENEDKFIVSCDIPIKCHKSSYSYKAAKRITLISKEGIEKICNEYEKSKPAQKDYFMWLRNTIIPNCTMTETN